MNNGKNKSYNILSSKMHRGRKGLEYDIQPWQSLEVICLADSIILGANVSSFVKSLRRTPTFNFAGAGSEIKLGTHKKIDRLLTKTP